jgi:hypothetical protein
MKEMEEMFAIAFCGYSFYTFQDFIGLFISQTDRLYGLLVDDDKKKAMTHLRTVPAPRTHHLVTFRVGLYLGLAVPALIDGLYTGQHLFESSGICR